MTDRELLELAAKAAGIDFFVDEKSNPFCRKFGFKGHWIKWNTLTDDGDALRLAVRLNMNVWVIGDTDTSIANDIQEKHIEQDRYAATRRSIVRAAAEIGKAI